MTERNREPEGHEPEGGPPPKGGGLAQLKARLAAARAHDLARSGGRKGPEASGVGVAVRVGIELAGTLAVGVGIGWLLDRWLGTGPWLLVVFFFLGAAGGVLNVYRAVKNLGLVPGYGTGPGRDDADEGDGTDAGR
ncbi:MAG TPA: AtpZ/AtpI family protein [Alphaproteobacteria bacterium]|nr:AtpZ/AtpI family protein [Alphaproteobacteria bacterium]